jgi:hypothetical protein
MQFCFHSLSDDHMLQYLMEAAFEALSTNDSRRTLQDKVCVRGLVCVWGVYG